MDSLADSVDIVKKQKIKDNREKEWMIQQIIEKRSDPKAFGFNNSATRPVQHVFFGTEFWPTTAHVVYVEDLSFYFIRMNSTSSNYGIINPSRSQWKLKYNSLRDVQKIIHIEKSRDGKIGVGWIPGWCTFWPGGKVTLDLQSETLVTKISFCQASSNCNARASKIEVSCIGTVQANL